MDKTSGYRKRGSISRREFLRLSGATLATATLASCGVKPTPAPVEAPPPAGGLAYKGALDIWDWEFAARQDLLKIFNADWEKAHPDIKINYTAFPWADIETKILAVATAKNAPPISDVYYGWRYDLQRAEVILPFPDDFADWGDRLSTDFMKDDNGKVRAFPSGWFVDMIYFNKDIFEQEGLKAEDIPANWDDFIKLAQQLTQTDGDGKVTRAGCGMNDYWQHEYLWQGLIYQQGGWMYNEDGTQALWESQESIDALQFIQDWYLKHKIDSRELPEGYGGFCNDQTAMFLGSGWNTGFFLADFPQMKDRFDTVKLPTFTGKPLPSYGLASPEENFQAFSDHPAEVQAAAFEWIKFIMASPERSYEWSVAQSCAPDVKSLFTDERLLAIPGIKSQTETMPYRVCFGERPLEAEKLWRAMFDQVILENVAPKEALAIANKAINEVLPTKKRYIRERAYKPPAS